MIADPRKAVVPSYDVASRLTQMNVDSATYLDGVSYNTSSQVTSLTTGSSMSHPRVENYSYDSQTGLLTGQTVKNTAATSTYLDLTYSYARGSSHGSVNGKTGQLTKIVDNLNRNRDKLYEFDSVGRLMKAHGGLAAGATGVTANWTQTYTYDRYGNKTATSVSGDLEDTTRAPRDGLSSVSVNTATNRVNTSGWEYDLTGNLIRGKDGTAWQKFEYDAAGRLVKIKNDSNTVLETYTYGASRERLMVETSSQRRYFAWGGQNVVAEYVETGAGTTPEYSKSYIYAGSRLFMTATKASSSTETKEFHHPDRLGTQLITEGSTGSSFRQSTMPFGTAISTETTGNTNQVFTSYDRSSTTGLDYAQNRTYSQGQSRFTQVDPIEMHSVTLDNPQSSNLYSYVQNMPTDLTDPSGLTSGPYLSPMGVAYYVDGFLSDWRTAWSHIMGGGGWLDYSNVEGISYATFGYYENDNWVRAYQHIWPSFNFDLLRFFLGLRLAAVASETSGLCADALKALKISPQALFNAFDQNEFWKNPNEKQNRANTTWPGKKGKTRTGSNNGLSDFVGQVGWLIHEMVHAALRLNDQAIYNRLKRAGVNIALVQNTSTRKTKSGKTITQTRPNYSDSLSNFFNDNCK